MRSGIIRRPRGWSGSARRWSTTGRLAAAAALAVLIAAVGAVASYVDHYYTESVRQWVANDLRLRVYDHLEHLSSIKPGSSFRTLLILELLTNK